MNYLVFARVVAISLLYLEAVNEEALDLDTAVQGMEEITATLNELNPEEIALLDSALQQVALEYRGEQREMVKNLAKDCGLVDDPEDEDGADG
ncbi:hypothetical protein [Sphingomonas corticis]|jgi:hypothetical protein|uniref:Uncharacterized protein n=1 Tax=Sphingomonas corticis TaxID=2722791 RepID=A0ABX1CNX9_9SPHN|nr:hypothetical protein [Sphingomonas corticis]NJR78010.1 hypothetical protein [Sphingomonas corticis]